jgi:hypothetical protein
MMAWTAFQRRRANEAPTLRACVIVTKHTRERPEQAPDQPLKTDRRFGSARRATRVPAS